MASKNTLSADFARRVDAIREIFARESPEVRAELARVLPAYNALINMHAQTFEEFALQSVARDRGISYEDPLFDYRTILPPCPKCGETENIHRTEENVYLCNSCRKRYAANYKSISSGTNCKSIVWYQVLQCLLRFYTVDETCKYCGIATGTYYNIRNRLFYAMQIMMNDVKLYGNIQCDNTFVRLSFKGANLSDEDYPEDSIFYTEDYKPRKARARGRSNKYRERNMNTLCLFACIDECGHVMARVVGIGAATASLLRNCVGNDKILLNVPETETCPPGKFKEVQCEPGTPSLLISDKESAIKKFADEYGIAHECHVYRANGVQHRLPDGAHHIQNVNQLHHKLKDFLRKTNHIASRYIPGFLVFFEFIQNTGASQEAIEHLFRILSAPGLGRPKSFFAEMFETPNYLKQWLSSDNPLRYLHTNQVNAFFYYNERKKAIEKGLTPEMTVKEIADMCNLTPSSVRRNYKNLKKAGAEDRIEELFFNINPRKKGRMKRVRFSPERLMAFDDFYANRLLPAEQRLTAAHWAEKWAEMHGEKHHHKYWDYIFAKIVESGVRPPLPELKLMQKNPLKIYPFEVRAIALREEYENRIEAIRRTGKQKIDKAVIISKMAEEYGMKFESMKATISRIALQAIEKQEAALSK